MRRISLILLIGLVLLLGAGCRPAAPPGDGVVRAVFFWADT